MGYAECLYTPHRNPVDLNRHDSCLYLQDIMIERYRPNTLTQDTIVDTYCAQTRLIPSSKLICGSYPVLSLHFRVVRTGVVNVHRVRSQIFNIFCFNVGPEFVIQHFTNRVEIIGLTRPEIVYTIKLVLTGQHQVGTISSTCVKSRIWVPSPYRTGDSRLAISSANCTTTWVYSCLYSSEP